MVKPGDKIPLDGLIVMGTSVVNQATITGESMPVTKHVGEEVFLAPSTWRVIWW